MDYYELKRKFDGKKTISINDAQYECNWMNEHYPDSSTKFFVSDCSDKHQRKTGADWEHYSGYNYELILEKNGVRKKIQDSFKGKFLHFSISTDKNDNLIYEEN